MPEKTGYEQLNSEERDHHSPSPEEQWLFDDNEDQSQFYNGALPLAQRIVKKSPISTSAPAIIRHSKSPQYHDDEEAQLLLADPFNDSNQLSGAAESLSTSSPINYRISSEPISKRPKRSHSIMSIDLKTINNTVSRWTNSIAKWTLSSKPVEGIPNEIQYSVFKPPSHIIPLKSLPIEGLINTGSQTKTQFDAIVGNSIESIENGVKPKRIAAGSSGSYFIYDSTNEIVGVFKPKDEEPYGPISPKWTKWLHRNLFPCFFGRSCLIPNLGYICETAASLLDKQLQTDIVPYTDTVFISSDSFYYSFWDRQSNKPLHPKIGSYQLFLNGYQEANKFFTRYPLPGSKWNLPNLPGFSDNRIEPTIFPTFKDDNTSDVNMDQNPAFDWTPDVIQQFREELEKLVILDYIMRNTDRGLDNWMIKLDWQTNENGVKGPLLKIGAIDSGLSWPWKHPDEWRSYPFGWLFLPVSIIGQPFSESTRNHFLPLLTSTVWWEESAVLFRQLFARDDDFKERMWKKQWAVMKGQAFNVVETLKNPTQGPLELARRTRVLVHDEEMEVPVHVPVSIMSNAIETPINAIKTNKKKFNKSSSPAIPTNLPPIREDDKSITAASPSSLQQNWNELLNGDINETTYRNSVLSTPGTKNSKETNNTNDEDGITYAQDTMATKKVIIERLQMVSSKPPVFTWC